MTPRPAGAALLGVVLLSACASAPKQSAGPAHERPAVVPQPVTAPASVPAARPRSPYAPAQEDPSKRGDYVAGGLFRPGEADTVPDYIPNVDAIPEPEVRDEPRSRIGNRSPYTVQGRSYEVRDSAAGYVERGIASYYGNKFHGRRTSNQEVYDMYAFTAAHRNLPLPSFARVTNLDNGRSVVVRVNDRGPFHPDRLIDLSYAAAVKLGYREAGTARVEVRGLTAADVLREGPGVFSGSTPPSAPHTGMDRLVQGLPAAPVVASAPPVPATAAIAVPPPAATPVVAVPATPRPGDYRFDMRQDGRAMTAVEFAEWMRQRQLRVATGVPGRPLPAPLAAGTPAVAAMAPPPPAPQQAAQTAAAQLPATAGGVTLQVASFANPQNAQQALAMLLRSQLQGARLESGLANGRTIWRLRLGPIAAEAVPGTAARLAALGFGQAQPVRP